MKIVYPTDVGTSNFISAYLLINNLVEQGITQFCISPGSRSTPMVLAINFHPKTTIYPILDERSASFFALGMIKADNNPVALICTSGTAVSNYFPAIIEAYETNLPLIVISADRPSYLRNVETNQTIDQRNIFGKYCIMFHELEIMGYENKESLITQSVIYSELTTTIKHTILNKPGPIHLNFPFSKPLEPSQQIPHIIEHIMETIEFYKLEVSKSLPNLIDLQNIGIVLDKIMIIVGPNRLPLSIRNDIVKLAEDLDILIIADPLSGLRQIHSENILRAYDHYISQDNAFPDLIIKFGSNPVSAKLEKLLRDFTGTTIVYREKYEIKEIKTNGEVYYQDYSQLSIIRDQMAHSKLNRIWNAKLQELEEKAISVISEITDRVFEGGYIYRILNKLGNDHIVFAGNSLSIRHLSEFMTSSTMDFQTFGNRGVSGIDGNVSTFCGIANQTSKIPVLIIGDLTLLHDLNGLTLIKRHNIKAIIILLNNAGGGIFHRLPVSKFEPPFTDLFKMEYKLDYQKIAELFDLEYRNITNYNEIDKIGVEKPQRSILYEIKTNSKTHQEILSEINQYLKEK